MIANVGASYAQAGIFDDDTQNWRRIFAEIKKINARLVTLETGKLKMVQKNQEDQLRQIEELKVIIPELRGALEQNQSHANSKIDGMVQRLGMMEERIQAQKLEILEQVTANSSASKGIEAGLSTQFQELKTQLAGDMETFAKNNQENMGLLSKSNGESLAKVVDQLKGQNKNLNEMKQVFASEVIPAMAKQNQESREVLANVLAKVNEKNMTTMTAGFEAGKVRNTKMIEILQQSLQEDQEAKSNVDILNRNLDKVNGNVLVTQETMAKLRDILGSQLDTLIRNQDNIKATVDLDIKNTEIIHKNLGIADQKMKAMADSFKSLHQNSSNASAAIISVKDEISSSNAQIQDLYVQTGTKLSDLTKATRNLATHASTQSGQSGQSLEKISNQLATVDVANQKLSKLIEIMKTLITEQGKIDKVLNGQSQLSQNHRDIQVAQGQIMKAQKEMQAAQVKIKAAQDQVKNIKAK
jgi:hypothetical protein